MPFTTLGRIVESLADGPDKRFIMEQVIGSPAAPGPMETMPVEVAQAAAPEESIREGLLASAAAMLARADTNTIKAVIQALGMPDSISELVGRLQTPQGLGGPMGGAPVGGAPVGGSPLGSPVNGAVPPAPGVNPAVEEAEAPAPAESPDQAPEAVPEGEAGGEGMEAAAKPPEGGAPAAPGAAAAPEGGVIGTAPDEKPAGEEGAEPEAGAEAESPPEEGAEPAEGGEPPPKKKKKGPPPAAESVALDPNVVLECVGVLSEKGIRFANAEGSRTVIEAMARLSTPQAREAYAETLATAILPPPQSPMTIPRSAPLPAKPGSKTVAESVDDRVRRYAEPGAFESAMRASVNGA